MKTPYKIDYSKRDPHPKTSEDFHRRWSPRAFKKTEIPAEERAAIFDAARWAPSAYNEQPWRILTSSNEEDFNTYLEILYEQNQQWAKNSSILGFICAKNTFTHNDKPNIWAQYDCGFAWASITFQANKLGYFTHGMAGFDAEKVYTVLGVSRDEYTAVAAFAIGVIDTPEHAPDWAKEFETPSDRKKLSKIYFPGMSFKNRT